MSSTRLTLGILAAIVVGAVLIWMTANHDDIQSPPAPEDDSASIPAEVSSEEDASDQVSDAVPGPIVSSPVKRAPRASQVPQVGPEPASPSFDPVSETLKGRRLAPAVAELLEARLAQNPEDISARLQLLGFYSSRQFSSKEAREARQGHVLWFISNHPEMNLRAYGYLDRILDGAAYEQGKELWLQQANANAQNPKILGNAAQFFTIHDRPVSEGLLQQAQALEPENPEWASRLAQLYALDSRHGDPDKAHAAAVKALEQMESAQAKTADETRRQHNLGYLAPMAFETGDIDKAETYAAALLQQTAQTPAGGPDGDAVHRGNLVLGRIALRRGNLEEAKQYLLASANTTGSPVLGSFGPRMTLAKELLEQGEKEVVMEYLARCGSFWKSDKLPAWIKEVNQGVMPDFGANLD